MKIEFRCHYIIDINDAKLDSIINAFTKLLPQLLCNFFNLILRQFAESYMKAKHKPFQCDKCGNTKHFKWKTKHGPCTKIFTMFRVLFLNQLQVQCKKCDHKFFITRKLLGLSTKKIMSDKTRRQLGLIGSLASFRVSKKILSMFGWLLDKMTIWRCVQQTAQEIHFNLDVNEQPSGEADGTGIPIQGIKKRGKELKVFVQHKKRGGIRIAGLSIGSYDKDWHKLFKPLISTLKKFKQRFLLITDGDTNIFKAMKDKVKILLQRCLWHIPYQMKYYLWKDGVARKSKAWVYALGELFDICSIREYVEEDGIIHRIVDSKKERLKQLINYCHEQGYKNCETYLENAKGDMFTVILNRLEGKTTSHVERVMRTVNLRIDVGKWSMAGALNAAKIRLAYYYNGWDAI